MATHDDIDGSAAEPRRLLVCTPFAPRLDARHGGKATTQLLTRLGERHALALLCLRGADEDGVDPNVAAKCAYVEEFPLPPVPDGTLGKLRLRSRWALGLARSLPPWASDCRVDGFARRLRALVAEWKPDIVQLDLLVMAQYVAALDGSEVPRILVDYDPGAAWAAELLHSARGPRRFARRAELMAWRRYERTTRPRFDAIVVFADWDVPAVAETAGGVPITAIPLGIDIPDTALDPVGTSPPTVLFVGGFGHPPNVDAARWLAASIFPRVVEAVPDARLRLVGHNPGPDIDRLAGGAVEVHGSVADVTPYLDQAAVVAAPIRTGGSIRMKVLETLSAGKALVATPRAMEGTSAAAGEHYLRAADEEAFAASVVELLRDPERRESVARAAREWAVGSLGWAKPLARFEELYESLLR